MKMRDQLLDALRGIAILVVMFGHALQSANGRSPANVVFNVITSFWMPLFFLISGYASGFSSGKDFKAGALSLFKRLVVPYLIWAEFVYIRGLLVSDDNFSLVVNAEQLLKSEFWFLRVLFLIKLLHLIYECLRRRFQNACAGAGVALLVGVGFSFVPGQLVLFHHLPMYAIGLLFNKSGLRLRPNIWNISFCALLFVSGILGMEHLSGLKLIAMRKIMAISASVLILFACMALRRGERLSRWLAICGMNLLALYAVHWCCLFDSNLFRFDYFVARGYNLYSVGFLGGCVWLVSSFLVIHLLDLFPNVSVILFGLRSPLRWGRPGANSMG